MTFAQPSAPGGGDNFTPAEHNGHLMIVYPKSYTDGAKTKHGESSAADVDIVIVDKFGPDGKPLAFINARLFGNLARSVRNDVGGQVLGRLGQGPNTQGSPPWILQNFTDQDAAAAGPVDAAYRAGQFAQAANPMSGAPSAPAQQPAPPVAPQQQQWQPPTQQYGAPPASAPTPAPPQQWQTQPPAAAAPPAPEPYVPPTAPAPAAHIDPNLLAFLASKGLHGPYPDQATAEAVAAQVQ